MAVPSTDGDSGHLGFRDAGVTDVDAVVGLVESAYRGEASRAGWTTEADLLGGRRTDATAVRETLAKPGCRILLAETNEGLLGCCLIQRRADSTAYFGMFAVRPDLQGRGTGATLLAEAERIARQEWGSSSMRMTVIRQRKELIEWYERRGFRLTGETEPFPVKDPRFGIPLREDLEFVVLSKLL